MFYLENIATFFNNDFVDDEDKDKIRAAFRTWEESTCINFEEEELENKDNLTEEHIFLSKEIYGYDLKYINLII